jgi:hypothetical protein
MVATIGDDANQLAAIVLPLLRPDRQGLEDAAVAMLLAGMPGRSGGCEMAMSSSQSCSKASVSPRSKAAKAVCTISTFSCDIAHAVSRRTRPWLRGER